MPDSNREPEKTAATAGRYRLNLVMLVVFLILLTFWFYRHLHLYVTESILIGGTVTLWGAWKVVQSTVHAWMGEESATWTQQFLGRSGATEYLIFGLVLLGILWLTTSSIYLKYEGGAGSQTEIQVEVLRDGNPFLEPLVVTSSRRIAGTPFFFRWGCPELEFVISGGGYEPRTETFKPWSSLYLEVPFKQKSFHLLRLVLRNHLRPPMPAETKPSDWFIAVNVHGEEHRREDLRYQTIYLGAALQDLERLVGGQDRDELRRDLKGLLNRRMPPEQRSARLEEWESEPLYIETDELKPGDSVVVQVGRGDELMVNSKFTVGKEAIQTEPLDSVRDESQQDAPDETTQDVPTASPG